MKLNVVPPRTGLLWVRQGIRAFLRQPLALVGLFFMYWSIFFILTIVPFVGLLLALAALPVGFVGFMAATAEAAEGRFPMPTRLFVALRAQPGVRRAILLLGGAYAVLVLLTMLLAQLVGGPDPAADAASPEALASMLSSPAVLLASALQMPLNIIFALAPALAFWHGVSAGKAVFFSVVAIWRNLGALMVCGLAWLGVLFGIIFVLAMLLRLVGLANPAFFMPFALVLLAMVSCSVYFTFRDSFGSDDPPPATPHGESP